MAVIEAISSKASIKRIINYVTQDKKTTEDLITGKDCMAESCLEEMLYTKNLYNKTGGRQYIHIIQSFDPKDNLTPNQVHNAGLKLANTFNGFQVLVATHIDKEHLHNHFVINSVSFENGYKIQMSKKDLQYLKNYSDEICLEMGASVIPKKDKTNYIKRNEYRVAERGESWKFKLINAIDLSMAESTCKDDFVKTMNKLGYQVNWTDTRKYITYTTPEGYKCRDNKLFEEKYLKGNMEDEFRKIEREQQNSTRKSSSSISSADELLSNRANCATEYIRLEQADEGRKCEYEGTSSKDFYRYRDGQQKSEGRTTQNNIRNHGKRVSNYETEITRFKGRANFEIQKNKMENKVDSILSGIIAISNMVSNSQINNRPRRRIRRYRTLSKQAMKEYAMKQANSSGFDWFDEEEDEM
ncbi:MAG: relaxase/mobilization nuclease domain-containing protein [Clostridia bacterium]|nr:relaxase/mobilization nuclease domain-containing protein [Clostridia bacterium]